VSASLTTAQRELAARCAVIASLRFQRLGWEYGWRDHAFVPDAEELGRTIEELLGHLESCTPGKWGERSVSSGRLLVEHAPNTGCTDVYLHLGTLHEDGTVDVDEEPGMGGVHAFEAAP